MLDILSSMKDQVAFVGWSQNFCMCRMIFEKKYLFHELLESCHRVVPLPPVIQRQNVECDNVHDTGASLELS